MLNKLFAVIVLSLSVSMAACVVDDGSTDDGGDDPSFEIWADLLEYDTESTGDDITGHAGSVADDVARLRERTVDSTPDDPAACKGAVPSEACPNRQGDRAGQLSGGR